VTTLTEAGTGGQVVADAGRRRRHHPLRPLTHGAGLTGAVLFGLVVVTGLLAPVLAPYPP
jgi:peptide/nickel transport system permease protein